LITVILYGRNDSYGYNLHKRAAISLNCIAEVLSHHNDEIIFVDCNTPDDLPTFPEAIQDTLTTKTKNLLRILRLRPHLYDKFKKGSPLKTLEPLSRNIAIRRSNPENRWILSTNTDMVFVVRDPLKSLSDVVAELPDGFYELPRFEVPEGLWESVNRLDPISIISQFREWGKRLHLNEVILSRPDILFDGPGDFQLMLREQIFKIHGFNEEMVLGWHVDSNLCRRLYLLNGETKSLLEHVFAYHCDHTRQSTFLHNVHKRTVNDENRFVYNVTSPFLNNQAETWGIPNEVIEEIYIKDEFKSSFDNILEDILPGMSEATSKDIFTTDSYDHGQIYDTLHVFPFISDHLFNIPKTTNIGYFGGNTELLYLIVEFLNKKYHKGRILASKELLNFLNSQNDIMQKDYELLRTEDIIDQADLFIFDTGMMHFPIIVDSKKISFPESSKVVSYYKERLKDSFLKCKESEIKRLLSNSFQPRKFLLISCQHTWFESLTSEFLTTVLTPYSTHVRHGYLLPCSVSDNDKIRSFIKPLINFGLANKEKIKKIPLLKNLAKMFYEKFNKKIECKQINCQLNKICPNFKENL
jgi:hypothetical protein